MTDGGRVTLVTRLSNGDAVLSLSDNGSGIPEDEREKIFEPYFTTKPSGVGTGLGLAITRNIIRDHKGRISVQSEVGVGTTFTIEIPISSEEIESEDLADEPAEDNAA